MGSLKVNITCGGENMEVQQLLVEPDNWHHRFEISVVSKMENNKNVIRIEMNEVKLPITTEKDQIKPKPTPKVEPTTKPELEATEPEPIKEAEPKTLAKEETTDTIDGSVWL